MIRLGRLACSLAFLCAPLPAAPEPIETLDVMLLPESQREAVRDALEKRDYKKAETILVEQIAADPKSADLLILAARTFLLDKDPANAAIAFTKAEKIRPLEPSERLSLAMAYIALRRGAWARPELKELASSDPKNPVYPYWLARLDYDDRMYEEAIERFQRVLALDPEFSRAWDNLALSQEGAGRLEDAVVSYRRAVDLNRKQLKPLAWPPLNLGILLTKLDRLEEAGPYLHEALRYDSNLAAAHYRLGANLFKQGRNAEARTELERAAELDAGDPAPLYTLSQIYRSEGNTAAADEKMRQFRTLKKGRRRM